jgi:hypothetical protein
MNTIHRINPTLAVHTPLGIGKAIFLIDYGTETNSVWKVCLEDGRTLNFYDDDIRMYGNPMDGEDLTPDIPDNWKK